MERKINEELKEYLEKYVFPRYTLNERGHGIEHILNVIDREFELIEENNLDLNNNMVYTIGAYHDIGHHIDAKNHEIVSAELFTQDEKMKKFFDEKEIEIIKEAIEDHRASNSYEARSVYGKLISSADRNTDYISIFVRTYSYNIRHFPSSTNQQLIEEAYKHLKNKNKLKK